jgi:hypothetical protein
MAAIPQGVILIFTGANGDIPAGWERETTLDDKYPKGHLTPNSTGGAATHTHASPAHIHNSMTDHTHSITVANGVGNGDNAASTGDGSRATHGHGGPFTSTTEVNPLSSSVAVTYDAVSNDPVYKKVIFIKPSGASANMAAGIVAFVDTTVIPDGYFFADGTNSTSDLRNVFLKGASTGADSNLVSAGSTTNVHGIDHGHTSTHTHTFSTGESNSFTGSKGSGYDKGRHFHLNASTNSVTLTYASSEINLTGTETVEPLYKKLNAIFCDDGVGEIGMIGMWLGALGDIPAGWVEVGGMRGYHLKTSNTTSQVNSVGGANSHTHAVLPHSHSYSSSHIHTSANLTHEASNSHNSGSTPMTRDTTYHTVTVGNSSANASLEATTTSASSSSNEPPYRTVSFIRLNRVSGGGFIWNMV